MKSRQTLTVIGSVLACAMLVSQLRALLSDNSIWPPDDFVEYWAAAKLTLEGRNPYDPEQLLPLQQAAGRDTDEAIMMWNPPWSMAVVLPLGLVEARLAQVLWLGINLAAIGFCGDRLWRIAGGSAGHRWIGWVIALAFLPTLFALQSGQITPLVLLGGVLFLEFRLRNWTFLAGVATILLAVKPHLAYLVWLTILCDCTYRWKFGELIGGVVAGIMSLLISMAFDPHILHQYLNAMAHRPPAQWKSPTLGTLLREAFGPEQFRMQFVPVLFGISWFIWYWFRHRKHWNWSEQFPLLLLVSFVTAPYGAWPFDMVLLLPAIMSLVVLKGRANTNARWLIISALVLINIGCLIMNLLQTGSYAFFWVAPTVLVLYIVSQRTHNSFMTHPQRMMAVQA